jgi:hypothetical protein
MGPTGTRPDPTLCGIFWDGDFADETVNGAGPGSSPGHTTIIAHSGVLGDDFLLGWFSGKPAVFLQLI